MPTPTDKILYDTIKKELFKKITKHSAYRSGLLVQKYKEEYYKKHKNYNYYTGNKDNSNLKRWFKEKWENQRAEVGYKKKGDIYRPTIKINNKTPLTFNELTPQEIKNAMREKKKTGRVNRFRN